jgi:PAS domain S-box-containing protein
MNDRLASAILTTKKRDDDSHVKTRRIRKLPKSEAAVELRYRAILEQIPAIIYTDSVGEFSRTVYINPQVESTTGYTPKQWMTDRDLWFKIIHKDDQERVWAENIRTEESGEPYKAEYRIFTRDKVDLR